VNGQGKKKGRKKVLLPHAGLLEQFYWLHALADGN